MSEFIPVNTPRLAGRELEYLSECIETGWISSEGPFVARFEEALAAMTGRAHAVAVSSGTAALDIAVAALGLGQGDEVIMPSFTIISCANAVVRAGATPVLVDCDPQTWNMDVGQVESRIGPRTRAIMAVHIYGLPVDMEPLLEIAGRHGLKVIEDAAEAIGQTCGERPCGSFGDISTFSFYANKHITTGEGGMVLADDRQLAERARSFRNLCFQAGQRFVHRETGWNYRMTNLQAAVGVAQHEQLGEHKRIKRRMGKRYDQLLGGLEGVSLPVRATAFAANDYWVYGLVIDPERGMKAVDAMQSLAAAGIGTRPFFWPMHWQPVLKEAGLFGEERHPVSEHLAVRGFYLPSGLGLTAEQAETVAERVRTVFA